MRILVGVQDAVVNNVSAGLPRRERDDTTVIRGSIDIRVDGPVEVCVRPVVVEVVGANSRHVVIGGRIEPLRVEYAVCVAVAGGWLPVGGNRGSARARRPHVYRDLIDVPATARVVAAKNVPAYVE